MKGMKEMVVQSRDRKGAVSATNLGSHAHDR